MRNQSTKPPKYYKISMRSPVFIGASILSVLSTLFAIYLIAKMGTPQMDLRTALYLGAAMICASLGTGSFFMVSIAYSVLIKYGKDNPMPGQPPRN